MQSVKSEKISMTCVACGHVTNVDMRHKVTKYILKNPPSAASSKYNTKYRQSSMHTLSHSLTAYCRAEKGDAVVDKSDKSDKDKKKDKESKKAKKAAEAEPQPGLCILA